MVSGGRRPAARLIVVAAMLWGAGWLGAGWLGAGWLGAGWAGAGWLGRADASPLGGSPVKTVRYLGYRFSVPESWPVVYNSRNPRGCVNFDRHAVYLGAVSQQEFCPSGLLGTTESVLMGPGPARAATTSTEDQVARQVTVQAPRIVITATFDSDPAVIYRILASAALPAPTIVPPDPTAPDGAGAASTVPANTVPAIMGKAQLSAAVASYVGLGFDTCAAPSRMYMREWMRRSPYGAVGIYIGGADRACAQPNLSRGWVLDEARAGWRFIPLYAGPQAAFGEIAHPSRQGKAAAADAVVQARRLGFGPRTPLYYDMEAFGPAARLLALRFLSAWTAGLHRLGYSSGVYSSADSGVNYLASEYSNHRHTTPAVIFDALWNGSASTSSGGLHIRQWPRHKRIHQFSGNVTQTFGGDTINIDQDYVDVWVRSLEPDRAG
jgi:hypothetical protein